jgi:hypothetical protein
MDEKEEEELEVREASYGGGKMKARAQVGCRLQGVTISVCLR